MPAFVNSANLIEEASVLSFAIPVPAGVIAGDVMFGFLCSAQGHAVTNQIISRPAGWTAKVDNNDPGSGDQCDNDVSWKVATASEPGSYTWTTTVSGPGVGCILVYRNTDRSNPFNASALSEPLGNSPITFPSITSTVKGCLLVVFAMADNLNADGAQTYSVPTGYVSRVNIQNTIDRNSIFVAERAQGAAGTESGVQTSYGVSEPSIWTTVGAWALGWGKPDVQTPVLLGTSGNY